MRDLLPPGPPPSEDDAAWEAGAWDDGAWDDGAADPAAPRSLRARLLRPWFDPRPGELRGAVILLAGALALTLALWFDASRRPGSAPVAPAPVVELDPGAWAGPGRSDPFAPAGVGPAAAAPSVGPTVHVTGAVADPGLRVLAAGARVGDAVAAAGGALPDAWLERINLARPVADGEQVHVPRVGEEVPPPSAGGTGGTGSGSGSSGVLPDGRLDINRASVAELTTLPGIGPARAAAIVAAREEAPFRQPGDLRRVPGIGEATFQRLAPLIAVP
jgi:competence ComEA-like helix-hairpin-helix protein